MIIACIISFVVGAFAMMCAIGLMSCQKDKKLQNKVTFIVTKQKFLCLVMLNKFKEWIYLCDQDDFEYWNIDPNDFADMKKGEIRKVFLNLED